MGFYACEAGCCGSCVFTSSPGNGLANINSCKIKDDPEVQETFAGGVVSYEGNICAKYQLNPAALD